jgi:hypothetical protein
MKKIKILIVVAWAAFLVMAVNYGPRVDAQIDKSRARGRKPDMALIDKFDSQIQQRFLTEPFFGIARIAPVTPQPLRSDHLRHFSPVNADEAGIQKSFIDDGWDVGIYLYGRRAEPKIVKGRQKNDFSIRYRVNQPVPVTAGVSEREMQDATDMINQVKEAFLAFQNTAPDELRNFEFDSGDWSYVARPVRAVSQSCLKCHNDYVMLERLGNDKFKMRKRQVGDVNGILLYAFRRSDR